METTTTNVLVKRYIPGKNETPFYQTFELKFETDMTVLDALNKIKETQDPSLTYRWSCRMGICGSCAAVVNGKPVLMCQTNMRDIKQPVRIEPLKNFPVTKDLVVDISDAFEKMRSSMPYMERIQKNAVNQGNNLQSPDDLKKLDQTSQCIKCMICYSACPVYGLEKDFVGPAAAALAYRYQADTREVKQGKKDRMDSMIGEKGVWKCSFVGECSSACPKRVDPALALQRLKLMGALRLGQKAISK